MPVGKAGEAENVLMEDLFLSYKFLAFMSYSHRDRRRAKRIHAALERFRPDQTIIGRKTECGRIPERLRPIFRDREDLAAAHSLSERITGALADSAFLILLCSKKSAKSAEVNTEIARFKMQGKGNRILAVILDGKPHDLVDECFPDGEMQWRPNCLRERLVVAAEHV